MGCNSSKRSVVAPDVATSHNPYTASGGPVGGPALPENGFHAKYDVLERLGKGSFAQVHLARKTSDDLDAPEIAVKISDLRKQNKDSDLEMDPQKLREAQREACFLAKVQKHDSCNRVVDSMIEGCFSYIVLERCDCTLWHFLSRSRKLSELSLFQIFKGMLRGIADIHQIQMAHRDIKPDNFMMKDGVVKLCDFGFAEVMAPNRTSIHQCGTAPYMSPEMLLRTGYDLKTDMWSFSVLCYAFLFGTFPYQPERRNAEAMCKATIEGRPEPAFRPGDHLPVVSKRARDFVQAIFCRKPGTRMTAEAGFATVQDCIVSGELYDQGSLRPTIISAQKFGALCRSKRNKPEKMTPVDEMLRDILEKKSGGSSGVQQQ